MSDIVYDADAIRDKTLIAAKDVTIYNGIPYTSYNPKTIGIVKAGNPIGVVYSYVDADVSNNRQTLWWVLWPGSAYGGQYFYVPHHKGDFSVDALKQQGVLSVAEQIAKDEEANKPWYQQIADRIIPIGAGVVIAAAVIRGVLSKKNQ